MLRFSKNFNVKSIEVQVENNLYQVADFPKVFSIVDGKLNTKMRQEWKNRKIIDSLLWLKKHIMEKGWHHFMLS